MHSAGRNNPCGAKVEARDATGRGKVIPVVKKCRIGMNPSGENNPCGTKERNMDESGRPK